MDTPGLDVESVTGMVGGGAQVVVFTTGLGTPTGNPIAPVIKITGNARTARQMADNIDLDVSGIMDETETLDGAADRLFAEVLEVASGRQTKAETLGHREFAIHRRNPTIYAAGQAGAGAIHDRQPNPRPLRPAACGATGYVRWVICALLFFAATINYVDRQVIGILKPTLQAQFGWSEIDYADIIFAFQLAYAGGFLVAGRMMDRIGARLGFTIAIVLWSLAAIAHAEATAFGPAAAALLALLGLTYSRVGRGIHGRALRARASGRQVISRPRSRSPPSGFRSASARWRRASSTPARTSARSSRPSWFRGSRCRSGWYWAFIATGATRIHLAGVLAAALSPSRRAPAAWRRGAAHIRSDPPDPAVHIPWSKLLGYRQTWAFMIGKFLTDPIWWLYLFWIPDFLNRNHGIDLKTIGPPLVAIYLVADVGQHRRRLAVVDAASSGDGRVNVGRKVAMLVCALAVVPMVFASGASDLWVAVALVSIAAAAHQGWSANLFTTASDMFPRKAVGSVVGLGGMAGAVGGMLIAKLTGYLLQATGSYLPVFFIAAFAYLVALAIIHVLVPRLEPAQM